jgi:hypothetical protein
MGFGLVSIDGVWSGEQVNVSAAIEMQLLLEVSREAGNGTYYGKLTVGCRRMLMCANRTAWP